MAEQKIIPLQLEKSIDTSAVERDVEPWDSQSLILKNTGICREGGVTNLGAKLGLDSDYEETFYCSNGSKAQLKRDLINNCFHAYADGREVGITPIWAVKARELLPGNAADALATADGTLLLLYFSAGLATIEEVDIDTRARLHIKSFAIPLAIAYITLVRTKNPTWTNITSIAGYSFVNTITTKTITGYIISDGGVTVFSGTVTCALNSNPISIHAYYEHGWIFEIDVWNTNVSQNLWMIKTDGSSTQIAGGFQTKALMGDYNIGADTITYKAFADKVNQVWPFGAIGGTSRNWDGLACDKDGVLWACVYGGDIYKCPVGSTTFTAIGGTSRNWTGICADLFGNIWACVSGGDIYKCLYGSTTFTAIGGTSRAWIDICSDKNGNIYACAYYASLVAGGIYKSIVNTTTFNLISGTADLVWAGICADLQNNIFATVSSGSIYKSKSGEDLFTSLGTDPRLWRGIAADKGNNLWALAQTVDIYKAIADVYSFSPVSAGALNWRNVVCDSFGNMWACVYGGDIYKQTCDFITYGFVFTPPASDGAAWSYSLLTDANITAQITKQTLIFGGYGIAHSDNLLSFFNFGTPRDWTTNQKDVPEIYGDIWPELTDFALKVHTIGGLAAYVSASFSVDGIGAPITEIGELSPYYLPSAVRIDTDNYHVVYQRGDNTFGLIRISRDEFERMAEVSSGVVKVNTVSGLNVIDTIHGDLKMGANAFNGFAVVGFASSAQMGAYVARHRGLYGGSVDTGYKNNTAVTAGSVTFLVIPESTQYTPNNELIDFFVGLPPSSLNYLASIASGVAQIINNALLGTLYVDDAILPSPIGASIADRSIVLIATTALREKDYDGYQLGNEIAGQYNSFVLYGAVYFVDSEWIKSIVISAGNAIQSANRTVPVQGLRFIAASPQEAFFISDFDNALYTFNGGQSVDKKMLFNRRETIRSGAYSVFENTLALLEDSAVVFIRDGIVTQTPIPYLTPPRVFATTDGIWLTQDGYSMRFVFNLTGIAPGGFVPVLDIVDGGIWGTVYADTIDGGTWGNAYDTLDGGVWGSGGAADMIVALLWQSKFLGIPDRAIQMIDRFLIRLYKEDKVAATVTITYETSDEHSQNIEIRDYDIGSLAFPYDSEGYCYIEYIPTKKRNVSASLRIESNDKITILSAVATLAQDGHIVAGNR